MAAEAAPDRDWGLFARALGAGAVAAGVLFYALVLAVGWTPRNASELVFPLGALVFSVGLLGWSGVLLSGNALEGFSREYNIVAGWTVEGGRQAMALMITFGVGAMVGAALAGAPFGV
jgi:hypothetical protein